MEWRLGNDAMPAPDEESLAVGGMEMFVEKIARGPWLRNAVELENYREVD
jgi:hypothetical protein